MSLVCFFSFSTLLVYVKQIALEQKFNYRYIYKTVIRRKHLHARKLFATKQSTDRCSFQLLKCKQLR